jgi:hypothetical protein
MNYIEKQIARRVAKALLSGQNTISVDYERGYDCDEENFALTDIDKIIEASDAVDECHWMLDAERDGQGACATGGYVYFIWGNGEEGRTCVSDYTTNLEPIMAPIFEWVESADFALTGDQGEREALEGIVREMIFGDGTDACLQRVIDLCNEARERFQIERVAA